MLTGVSVQEQQHILRDIWLDNRRHNGQTVAAHGEADAVNKKSRQRPSIATKSSKQTRISSLFSKK